MLAYLWLSFAMQLSTLTDRSILFYQSISIYSYLYYFLSWLPIDSNRHSTTSFFNLSYPILDLTEIPTLFQRLSRDAFLSLSEAKSSKSSETVWRTDFSKFVLKPCWYSEAQSGRDGIMPSVTINASPRLGHFYILNHKFSLSMKKMCAFSCFLCITLIRSF